MDGNTTAREVLDMIDGAFCVMSGVEIRKLWAVLTALRGPDEKGTEAAEIKWNTTAIIRTKAFPRAADSDVIPADYRSNGAMEYPNASDPVGAKSRHFLGHAWEAAIVLGIHDETFKVPGMD